MRERVINYKILNEPISVMEPDVYRLRKNNKFTRALIKLLFKLKILDNNIIREPKYTRVRIDNGKVFELIREQINHLLGAGKRPNMVIIGYKQMRALDIELHDELTYRMDDLRYQRFNPDGTVTREIFGLTIKLNPYIDGVVVMEE